MPIEKVCIIGTGLIGASWATHYLACGLSVVATDPVPDAERTLRAKISVLWEDSVKLGNVLPGVSAWQDRLTFVDTIEEAVKGADFIQENGPEKYEAKKEILERIGDNAPKNVIYASSSSGLLPTKLAEFCSPSLKSRLIIGHPFNPPHVIPLVEIVAGQSTDAEVVTAAVNFYKSINKHPVVLKKEVYGHIANRLQFALIREAIKLLEEGVASPEDIDAACSTGPGLRWALLGPFLNMELGGGEGGTRHFLEHIGPGIVEYSKSLTPLELNPTNISEISNEVHKSYPTENMGTIGKERNIGLEQILKLKGDLDHIV